MHVRVYRVSDRAVYFVLLSPSFHISENRTKKVYLYSFFIPKYKT